ncbi:hypothetical protein [Mesorhizobium sp. Root102]|uniref:hypothetical protein n=1 Tax=Mesorhizobium sp. Root102 TaxID=1736422 RepID=UPI0012E36BE4|nr:hypothetical protein [Mesorhizobium sp. Root102]
MMAAPVLREIVRQHAEMAAFLWTIYDHHLLHPEENPEMDEVRLARLIERLEAHLDGLRVAGDQGRKIAQERFEEFADAGELFVLRMLAAPKPIQVVDLDLPKVREYLAVTLKQNR